MSATNRGSIRNHADAYQTPHWCIEALKLNVLPSQDMQKLTALEPCVGDGNIPRVFSNWNWQTAEIALKNDPEEPAPH